MAYAGMPVVVYWQDAPFTLRRGSIETGRHIGDAVTDSMVEDWKATLNALLKLQKLPEIGTGWVGDWGLSMGTLFGLPLVAAEPRIEVCGPRPFSPGAFATH